MVTNLLLLARYQNWIAGLCLSFNELAKTVKLSIRQYTLLSDSREPSSQPRVNSFDNSHLNHQNLIPSLISCFSPSDIGSSSSKSSSSSSSSTSCFTHASTSFSNTLTGGSFSSSVACLQVGTYSSAQRLF